MTVQELYQRIEDHVLVLDGATGTELQQRGMPKGVCPEQWVVEHPEIIIDVQRAYVEAGSEMLYTFTFGANPLKLEEFGVQDQVYDINKRAAQLAREAAHGHDTLIAGNISASGQFVEPFGDISFEDAVNKYRQQAQGLLDGGVDLFVIETMIDIQETRAALLAVKELCDLPVITSVTFSEEGHTLTGTDPVSALITLQSLGAHVVGCNCSTGPKIMLEFVKQLKPHAAVPLLAKPNAGLPQLIDGETRFVMSAEEFATFTEQFVEAGVNLFGGCCGTNPDFIRQVAPIAKQCKPVQPKQERLSAVTSARKTVFLPRDCPTKVIGERINPTGKKKLQASLREGRLDDVKRFAIEQKRSGAELLDVNMGMSGIDEGEMMGRAVRMLSSMSDLPLVIDSSNPEVVEQALRIYPGRALINSISAEHKKMERLLSVAAKYGAMFILLPLTDNEIPATCEGRVNVVEQIYECAQAHGLGKEDIVIDGLTMTVSSDQQAARETLKFIRWCRFEFGVNTVLGLSNISFGLPQRKWVNAAFMAMAIQNGLTLAIANPNEELLMNIKMAADVLTANDAGSKAYISAFAQSGGAPQSTPPAEQKSTTLYDCVVEGHPEQVVDLVRQALAEQIAAGEIVNQHLIPAINKVGEFYEQKIYFLPQLIASADTMKTAFEYLEPYLSQDQDQPEQKVKVVLATVKGDIHDIGKNIVALMLKNYGFEVIDLGKDVSADIILDTVEREQSQLVGLSALMTTTMTEMKEVIAQAKQRHLTAKFIVGGAVITSEYAREIQADGYARDSIEAVRLAQRLSS